MDVVFIIRVAILLSFVLLIVLNVFLLIHLRKIDNIEKRLEALERANVKPGE